MSTGPATVALALGSGGARGYAHVGVLQVLAEAGIEVVGIAGSSMGALVGGLHAAGRLDEYVEWATKLSRFDVARGMIQVEKVLGRVRDLIGDVRIEELPIPFTAVATDLLARKEVWFQDGPLDVAIRASIAIPTVISPLAHGGRLLVDGGLLDPVPMAPVAAVRADATVAVTLNGEPKGETAPTGLGRFDVMNLSIEAMQAVLTRYRFAGHPPDLVVSIPKDACRSLEFHRAAELVDLGRTLTIAALRKQGWVG